jgi:hypothetical protein
MHFVSLLNSICVKDDKLRITTLQALSLGETFLPSGRLNFRACATAVPAKARGFYYGLQIVYVADVRICGLMSEQFRERCGSTTSRRAMAPRSPNSDSLYLPENLSTARHPPVIERMCLFLRKTFSLI